MSGGATWSLGQRGCQWRHSVLGKLAPGGGAWLQRNAASERETRGSSWGGGGHRLPRLGAVGTQDIVPKGSRLVMEGLTLVNGSSQGDAGCVLVEANASLQIHHSVLSNAEPRKGVACMFPRAGVTVLE